MKVKSPSRVRLLATPWTVSHQAPLSMGFSRQEYWSGVPLPSLPYSIGELNSDIWLYLNSFKQEPSKKDNNTLKSHMNCTLSLQASDSHRYHVRLVFFWLHWVFIATCGLSLVATSWGHLFSFIAQASHFRGFSCFRAQALHTDLSSCSTTAQWLWCSGSVALHHKESSQTRDQTHVCLHWQGDSYLSTVPPGKSTPHSSLLRIPFASHGQGYWTLTMW